MKCPLFVMSYMLKVGEAPTHQADCLKEECAWWDTAYELCVLRSIARLLDGVLMDLNQIRDKMPHAGQFLK